MRRICSKPTLLIQTAVKTPVRLLKRKLSPDRTRDEEIQDRQNGFIWSEKHIFRPHQHFTYDPCSWSRTLEENVKAKKKLSIIERLRVLEEQQAEALKTSEEVGNEDEPVKSASDVDYFYSENDSITDNAATLQELLDRLNELNIFLTSPRHAGCSLTKLEKIQKEYKEVLLIVFDRVQVAVVDETMTFDALLYSWFFLLQGAQQLLEALTGEQSGEKEFVDVILKVRYALDKLLLDVRKRIDAPLKESIVLESWIELFDVITHPFIRHSSKLKDEKTNLSSAIKDISYLQENVYQHIMNALVERMLTSDASEFQKELLDPQHLQVLLHCMVRYSHWINEDNETYLQRVALLTKKVVEGILTSLKGAVAPPAYQSIRLALLGKTNQRVAVNTNEAKENDVPRAIVLDVCSPPSGVKDPVTAANDALCTTRSCLYLLQLTTDATSNTRIKVVETSDKLLLLLSHTPNYDLSISDTIDFACELLGDSFFLQDDNNSEERLLRIFLLLSRLQLLMCTDRTALCRLFYSMCNITPPDSSSLIVYREWKRLYGLVMHQLLNSLRAVELSDYYRNTLCSSTTNTTNTNTDTEGMTWEEHLAFGQYSGSVPISLWRNACQHHFTGTTLPSPACAKALFYLRSRCMPNHEVPTVTLKNSSFSASILDFDSVCFLAQLLHIMSNGIIAVDELTSDANAVAWDVALNFAIDDEPLLEMLQGARLCVKERQDSGCIVTTFA